MTKIIIYFPLYVTAGMLGTSAPVNIPRSGHNSCLGSFSPTRASPLHHLQSGFLSASRFSHPDALDSVSIDTVMMNSSILQ